MGRHRVIKPKGKLSQILFKIGGTVIDFINNIVTDNGKVGTNASLSDANGFETDGVDILEHASITSATTLLSNDGTATASTISFYNGGIVIYSGTMVNFVLSNGSRYACSEGNGLVCYDVVNSNDLVVNKGFLDGFSDFEVTNSATKTAISNMSDGVVEGVFFSNYADFAIYSVAQERALLSNVIRLNVAFAFLNTAFAFNALTGGEGSVVQFNCYIKNTIISKDQFIDGLPHTFKVSISANPTIEIDGVTYSGSDLEIVGTPIFTDEAVDSIAIGVQKVWNDTAYTTAKHLKGGLLELKIKTLDELTTHYSFESVGRTFSASATTIFNQGTGYVFDVWKKQNAHFANMQYGCDVYTLDTDTSQKLYIRLKDNGTSQGKTPVGYTYSHTIQQTGVDFLDTEILLDNTGAASLNAFWSTARTYEEIQLESSISKVQGVNKINKITTNV